jgi:hypothetical protein
MSDDSCSSQAGMDPADAPSAGDPGTLPGPDEPTAKPLTTGSTAGAGQRKPSVADYLAAVTPGNLVKLGSELLDQAANPYGTQARRRRRRKKSTG